MSSLEQILILIPSLTIFLTVFQPDVSPIIVPGIFSRGWKKRIVESAIKSANYVKVFKVIKV